MVKVQRLFAKTNLKIPILLIDTQITTKQNESRNQCSGTRLSMHIRFLTKEGSSCHQSFSEASAARFGELFRE